MMNRLQKKCLIATVGTHFLLIVLLLVGPGFFTSTPKPETTPTIEVLPDIPTLYETTGVKDPAPPPPTQPVTAQPVAQPTPPKAEVKPPEPVKQPVVKPEPETPETPEPPVKPVADTPAPIVKQVKPNRPKLNLTPIVRKVPPKPTVDTSKEEANEREQQRIAANNRKNALTRIARNIESGVAGPTRVDLPGNSTASAAQYAAFVKTTYENAWIDPDNASNDKAEVGVSVTIARDGHVIEAHITDPSGDAKVDTSVRRTLERVTFVKPFPEGDTESQHTFIIYFNLKAKRMLG